MTIICLVLFLLSIPIAVKTTAPVSASKSYSTLEHPVQSVVLLDLLTYMPLQCARIIYVLAGAYLALMIRYGVEGSIDKTVYTANCMMITFIVATLIKYVSQSERL